MNRSSSTHDPTIQEFYQWYEGAKIKSTDCFLPETAVSEYFKDPSRVKRLLQAVFRRRDDLPVEPQEIRQSHSKIFFILVLIDRGQFIEHFIRHPALSDQSLPIRATPPSWPISPTDPQFFSLFDQKQWEFCAPIFSDNMNRDFESQTVLPIVYKEKLAGGGSATTYKITLHSAYDRLRPNDRSVRTAMNTDVPTQLT